MIKERLILGKDALFSTDTRETGITNNVVVVGSSGAGKTASVIMPRLLETTESSIICSVSKRRVAEQFMPVFRNRGYRVIDLNFADPVKSNYCYDPIQYITSTEDIAYLSSAIVMSDQRKAQSKADPYWDSTSINLLNAIIYMTLATKDNATMDDVIKNVNKLHIKTGSNHIETTLDRYFNEIIEADPYGFCASNWSVLAELESIRTSSCILSSLQTMISNIFTTGLRKQIAKKPCVDIEKIGREKTALFITTSAMNPSLNMFINIFYGQAFRTLFETAMRCKDYRLPVHVSMLFDDFAVGGKLKDFDECTSIIREANMDYCILLQSESQLIERYGEYGARTILNNTDSYLFLGCNDYDTAKSVSLKADVPVETILTLPIGKEIIFRRGSKAMFTQRYETYKDERYIALFGKDGKNCEK